MTVRLYLHPMKPPESATVRSRQVVRTLPADLLVVVAFVLIADSVISVAGALPILQVLIGFPVLFFVPGYVVLAALFPGEHRASTAAETPSAADGGLELSTRLALSFGLSVALIPVFAVVLAFTPVGFGTASFLGLLTVTVVAGAVVGAVRRLRLPPERRFSVPVRRGAYGLVDYVTGPERPVGVALNALLVVSVLVAASGFAYAVFVPPPDAEFTDYLLLTRSADGGFVSSGYPTDFTRGEGQELVVGIVNHGDEATSYSVVVELQRIRGEGEAMQVVERSELSRFGATVGPDETAYVPNDVSPDLVGENLRLVYYFYRGDAPANPSMATADDHLHLWVDVSV